MIKFLVKGLLRDRSRSLFPVLIVMAGVMLTVFLHCWIGGYESNLIESNASFSTGHVKIMSRAYSELQEQLPNDLALIGIDSLLIRSKKKYPDIYWTPRIRFGGLLDIPNEYGETRDQGPVMGIAVDLFDPNSPEKEILNLNKAIVSGRLPEKSGEIVISHEFAQRLNAKLGETATLISSTMYGSFTTANFTIVGTVKFGISAMDRGAMVADLHDIQAVLDMNNASGEILGYFEDFIYRNQFAETITDQFNKNFSIESDEFSPIMVTLKNQAGLAQSLDMFGFFSSIIIGVFVAVMSLVLWNAGLMGSLRRYGEIGVRLAIGEAKSHIYRSMLVESIAIGLAGSLLGTTIGLAVSYYLQIKGLDFSSMMKNSSMMISNVIRTKVTPFSYVIGFIPGLLATFIGTSISGIGIFRRQTSQLAKEFEA